MDLKYINELIQNEIQENTKLEYKSSGALDKSDKKIEALSISVSSFANSDGGRLIIGIKEFDQKDKRHLPEKITPIDIIKYPKEWIEQVINDNITPRISGLQITPIKVLETEYVYVIDVEKSDTAHQAKDFKYYKRHVFRKLPMQDYEIRDVLNRNKFPKIECKPWLYIVETEETKNPMDLYQPQLSSIPGFKKEPTKYNKEVFLQLSGLNVGKKTAFHCKGKMLVPKSIFYKQEELKWEELETIEEIEYVVIDCTNKKKELLDTEMVGFNNFKSKYGPSTYEPIIPHSNLNLGSCRIKDDLNDLNYKIYWKILVDESTPTKGSINSQDLETETKRY